MRGGVAIVKHMRIRMAAGATICAVLLAACAGSPALPPAADDPPSTLTAPPSPIAALRMTSTPSPSVTPTEMPLSVFVLPTHTPYPNASHFSLGQSVQGRPIWAWQFGDGPYHIVLVGGIHGGYEANSTLLTRQLIGHFLANPADVLPGIQLVIIPAANPDGLARGDDLEGRSNANGVDLNRNWGCGWSEEAYLRDMPVDPGPYPFSEPETRALRAYFIAKPPDAVIFYHSVLGAVFTGECGDEHPPARWLGELIAEATGYPYKHFTYYDVTGDATNWLAERSIPALTVELSTRTETEFQRNWKGIMALQCHFVLGEAHIPALDKAVHQRCANLLGGS